MTARELTLRERIKGALMRQREEIRRRRYDREFRTIYDSNLCPICHHRHMVGVVCRWHRGSVCAKHCAECQYHEPRFYHCLYRETEPIDMRKWRLIYGCMEKANLSQGIHQRVLLERNPILQDKSHPPDEEWGAAYRAMMDALTGRTSPKYAIGETPDENGDYAIVDTDTGEIQGFVAKFLQSCGVWACVEYLPAGA